MPNQRTPGHYEEALECFGRSLAFNRDYEKARSWQQKLLAEMAEAAQQQAAATPLPQANGGHGNGNGHGHVGAGAGAAASASASASALEPPEVDKLSLTSEGGGDARVAGVGTVAMQEEGEEAATTMLT